MTDDELAFLRAAAADPDEDTLRLAYADWLDEQGGDVFASQAALARLQVRRARLDLSDPARATLLEEETALTRKHKRDWNGRLHRFLARSGFAHKVDARRGLLRGWDYRRGMIACATVSADALTVHAKEVFALGPVEHLRIAGPFVGWPRRAVSALAPFLPRLNVVSVAGVAWAAQPDIDRMELFAAVPVLDLRAFGTVVRVAELLALARIGTISPVVLYRATVRLALPPGRRRDFETDAHDEVHVIDPHGKWDALRAAVADLTGEVLSPLPYQGAQ